MSRRLSEEDHELWARVARTARQMRKEGLRAAQPEPDRLAPVAKPAAAKAAVLAPKAVAPLRPVSPVLPKPAAPRIRLDLALPLEEALRSAPLQMDAGTHRKMSKGRIEPEARIDLHGMTREQAREALMGFVLAAQGRGLRLLLVITGKGRERADNEEAPMPSRMGTLRHDLPHWLEHPLLRRAVLELRPAHRSHGGGGAFYLYLRRRR